MSQTLIWFLIVFLLLVVLASEFIIEEADKVETKPVRSSSPCTYGTTSTNPDPVHKHTDGTWWWHDEKWPAGGREPRAHGPHQTEAGARVALKKYEEGRGRIGD